MKTLIWYIRSCFCKHDFEKDEKIRQVFSEDNNILKEGTRVSLLCKKCGYHRSFWKFL